MTEPGVAGLVEARDITVCRGVSIQRVAGRARAMHRAGPLTLDGNHPHAGGVQPAQDLLRFFSRGCRSGEGTHILGACNQGLDKYARVAAAGGHSGPGESPEPDADDLPAARGCWSRCHDLGTFCQRRDALSACCCPDQVRQPVTDCAGVLVAFLAGETAHSFTQGSDDLTRVALDHLGSLLDDDGVVLDALPAGAWGATAPHFGQHAVSRPAAGCQAPVSYT